MTLTKSRILFFAFINFVYGNSDVSFNVWLPTNNFRPKFSDYAFEFFQTQNYSNFATKFDFNSKTLKKTIEFVYFSKRSWVFFRNEQDKFTVDLAQNDDISQTRVFSRKLIGVLELEGWKRTCGSPPSVSFTQYKPRAFLRSFLNWVFLNVFEEPHNLVSFFSKK